MRSPIFTGIIIKFILINNEKLTQQEASRFPPSHQPGTGLGRNPMYFITRLPTFMHAHARAPLRMRRQARILEFKVPFPFPLSIALFAVSPPNHTSRGSSAGDACSGVMSSATRHASAHT